jgi:hypothetical protein
MSLVVRRKDWWNEGMHFRQSLTVGGLSLHPDGVDPLWLSLERDHHLEVVLSTREAGGEVLHCDVTTEVEPNSKVRSDFEKLAEDRLPRGAKPPKDLSIKPYIDPDGRIEPGHVAPLHLTPTGFQDFCNGLSGELSSAARDAVGVLRWRSRSLGPPRPFSSRGMQWSFDGELWHGLPRTTSAELMSDDRLELTESGAQDLQRLLDERRTEPTGHDLFREASSQRSSNHRGSLLLGVAALEVGVKEYIVACEPNSEAEVMGQESPPVVDMLEERLPALDPPGGAPRLQRFDKDTIEALRVGVQIRNSLAHRGAEVPSHRLRPFLRAVRNVLWTLDAQLDEDWASAYVIDPKESDSVGYRRVSSDEPRG